MTTSTLCKRGQQQLLLTTTANELAIASIEVWL